MAFYRAVPSKALDAALAFVKAGGRLAIPTYTRITIIDQKTIDRFEKAGCWLLKEDGDGYRVKRGKTSDYVFTGGLKYIIED